MNGVNRVILVGNLGKDPDLKVLENGTKVAKFTMATNERYTTRSGEKMTKTEWHSIVLWRSLAENAERLLKKGSLIYLEGKLRTSSYTDKDGNQKYNTEVEAENFTLLNRLENDGAAGNKLDSVEEPAGEFSTAGGEDDLPF